MESSPIPDILVFVDTETTGTNSFRDRIIEIALIKVKDNHIIDTFHTLINPELDRLPPEISLLTGISSDEILLAPTFAEIKNDIRHFLNGCLFVAHNARFDYGFIRREFKRCDETFETKTLCTVKLSRRLFPQEHRHSLDNLILRHQLACPHRHRAYDDAHVLFQFFQSLQHNLSSDILGSVINNLTGASALPLESPLYQQLKDLPSSPGVYIFYSAANAPLYIGKSVDIKSRVYSHFYQNINNNTDRALTRETGRIEAYSTSGELGALILESQLIKELKPLYNRRLKSFDYLALSQVTTPEGYFSLAPIPVKDIDVNKIGDIFGIFPNKNQLKKTLSALSVRYSLCDKLLGTQTTNSSCFAYHLGRCKGACIGKEHFLQYNLRFLEAFSSYRIRPWPFPSPIALIETNPETGNESVYIIDKWCLLAQADDESSVDSITPENYHYCFDYDLYKILKKFLLKKKKPTLKVLPFPKP